MFLSPTICSLCRHGGFLPYYQFKFWFESIFSHRFIRSLSLTFPSSPSIPSTPRVGTLSRALHTYSFVFIFRSPSLSSSLHAYVFVVSTSHITHKPCIHSPPLPFIRLEKSSISLFYSDRLPLLLPSLLRTLMHEMCVFIHLSSPLSLLLSFFFSFLLSSSQKNASQQFTYQHPLKLLRTALLLSLLLPSTLFLYLPLLSLLPLQLFTVMYKDKGSQGKRG